VPAILDDSDLLAKVPHLGRPMDHDTSHRELLVSFGTGAYVLHYRQAEDGTSVIICVWHSREQGSA
jgi:plasmid stabilization system protein ParE